MSDSAAPQTGLVEAATRLDRLVGLGGFVAFFGAGVSMAACYFKLIAGVFAITLGVSLFSLNVHVQAVLMWAFVLVAVAGLAVDRKRHGRNVALAMGCLSFVFIAGTLYTTYDPRVEVIGYLLLVTAAFLNQYYLMDSLRRRLVIQTQEVERLNASLESKVAAQVAEIERLARLRRFLSPEVADLITREGDEALLQSHRRLVTCLFCDIRNFTAFSEDVEPEDVMDVLQDIHGRAGQLVADHGGMIGYRSGDGLMVIFNDPMPCEDPVMQATTLALELHAAFAQISRHWAQLGYDLGFGIGIAHGYATLGMIGSAGRNDYTAIGSVVNLASRLCDAAANGQILVDPRALVELKGRAEVASIGPLELKGLGKADAVFNVTGLREAS